MPNSNLRGFLADSQLQDFAEQFLPRVLDKLAEKQPDAKEPLAILRAIAGPYWRHPSALFISGIDLNNPNGPTPRLGLLCDAGNEADALERQLKDVVKLAADAPFPIRIVRAGNLVAWVTGYEKERMRWRVARAQPRAFPPTRISQPPLGRSARTRWSQAMSNSKNWLTR